MRNLETKLTHDMPSASLRKHDSREAAYDKARLSLRIWPIKGNDKEELEMSFREFAIEALQVSQQTMDEILLAEIIRVYMEVNITFFTVSDRDFFNSEPSNLASFRNEQGLPEAGIRMDIPSFLLSTFKLLNDHSYEIRNVHGKETKRYVKFDEERLSLILEALLEMDEDNSRASQELL